MEKIEKNKIDLYLADNSLKEGIILIENKNISFHN